MRLPLFQAEVVAFWVISKTVYLVSLDHADVCYSVFVYIYLHYEIC